MDKCDVSPVARRSAELLYLSRFGQLPIDPEHEKTIQRLESIYGPIERANKENTCNNHCGLNTLRLSLIYKEKTIERRLPINLPIHKIVGMAARLFDFDPLDDITGVELRRSNLLSEFIKRTENTLLGRYDLDEGDIIVFLKNE